MLEQPEGETIVLYNEELAISELSETELDLVAAGAIVNVNVPVAINIGVALAGQANIALFSLATQGGTQTIISGALAYAKA
jgi:hypothetical protein